MTPIAILAVLCADRAFAGDIPVGAGIGIGLVSDLSDRASRDSVQFKPGVSLTVPIRVQFSDVMRLRIEPRFEFASGVDRLTWDVGDPAARAADDHTHKAFFGLLGLDVGVDAVLPIRSKVRPYLHGEFGLWGAGVYHAMRGTSLILLDPEQNEVGNPNNIDPYTTQLALGGNVGVGALMQIKPGVELTVDLGYGGAYLGAKSLKKAPAALDARREAFAFNPIRFGVGLIFYR